jgi:hypothetical protein
MNSDDGNYFSLKACLTAAFELPEGIYPCMDYDMSIAATKMGALTATERGAGGSGILPKLRNGLTSNHFTALKTLYAQSLLTESEVQQIIDYVQSKLKNKVSDDFIKCYSLPLWVGSRRDVEYLGIWSERMQISLRTAKRRSYDVNIILERLEGNAKHHAVKILTEERILCRA